MTDAWARGPAAARRAVSPIVGGPVGRPDLESSDAAPYDCRPALGTGRRGGEGALHGDAVAHARSARLGAARVAGVAASHGGASRVVGAGRRSAAAAAPRTSAGDTALAAYDEGSAARAAGRRLGGGSMGPRGVTWRSTSRDSSTPSRRAADGVPVPVSAIGIRSTNGIARGGRHPISPCHLPGAALRSGSRAGDLGDPCSRMARGGAGPAGRALVGRAVPVVAGASRPGAAGAAPAARAGPALLDENRLRGQIGPRAANALQRCFVRERRAFLIPVCPPLWKTQKDDGCTCSGSALVPGKTGARDRYGHALTGWEVGSRHYAATAGSTWRRRRPRSWASGRPKAPAGRFAYIVFDGSATAIRLLVAAVLAGPVGARLRERADVVGRHRAVRSARPVGGRGRGAGRQEIGAGAWSEVSRRRASALTPTFISRMRLHGRNRQRSSTRRRHVGRGARQERFGSPDRCRRAGFSRAWHPESAGGRSLEAENCQRCQRLRPA